MALTAAFREQSAFAYDDPPSSRDEVLARYRQFREISKQHHQQILASISGDALLNQARRLGLARGKTLILEDMEEMNYVYDLAIHTASPPRSRAIDRFAGSARFAPGSDEALVLEAMRAARFSVLVIERHHETAGLVATDLFRRTEVWLVDIGLESSMTAGEMFATRLFTPARFSMTAGTFVPFELDMLTDILVELPRRLVDGPFEALPDNRHFTEAIYRIALADGIMDRVTYQDLSDGA
ncbi:hypothetical protein [Bradyrhizobium sp.]|uniref:hypothetical protein n=1 Tax=Bradyrhizobium sp. TaxID=376 RepID=UPI002DFB330A|nr:hypothetical protein [Bradyrhizobium sp.]